MIPAHSEHKSLKLFNISHIELRIHWSVFVLLAFLGVVSLHAGFLLPEALAVIVGTLSLLLIHTLGHIFVIRFLSWNVTPIVIYPFGDLYKLDEKKPFLQHTLVTLGGIASSALAFFSLIEGGLRLPELITLVSVKEALTDISLLILVLNILPLVPSDLGRLVQLYSHRHLSQERQSSFFRFQELIAAALFLFGIWYGYPLLAIVAIGSLFIISREHYFSYALQAAHNHYACEITSPPHSLLTFQHGTTLSAAQRALLQSSQQVFPVMLGDKLLGYLDRNLIRQSIHQEDDCYLSEVADRDYPQCTPQTPLQELLIRKDWSSNMPLAVIEDDIFLGLISYEQFIDFILLQRSYLLRAEQEQQKSSVKKMPSKKNSKLNEKKE